MKKNIELIALVYKSTSYLDLITNEFQKPYCKVNGWNVGTRIVANDAHPLIIQKLKNSPIPYSIYNDRNPNDYYLNRVYRCWNYGGFTSKYDNICFINSDMIFSRDWLSNLLEKHNGINIPTSRLVESGKLQTAPGRHGIIQYFGHSPQSMNYMEWYKFANEIREDKVLPSGLLMPCVFETQRFKDTGGYPEGNIYSDGIAGSMNGDVTYPGDVYYFEKLEREYGMKHITVFNSLVYHFQEGELDE